MLIQNDKISVIFLCLQAKLQLFKVIKLCCSARILYKIPKNKIPNGQNPERTKSRIGQNPEWTKSRIGQNPEWTKSRIGRNPEWTKSRIGQNPEWTKS